MIRPLPRHNPGRQSLAYPKYGQFGFEEPVGRKHLRNKLSAIHKIIFNEEVEPITRDVYNGVKMNLQGSFLQNSRQKSSSEVTSMSKYGEDSRMIQEVHQNKYKKIENGNGRPENLSKSNGEMSYNIIQNQYSERYNPSNSRTQKRDSLDSILNPYKPYQKEDFRRELSLQSNGSNNNSNLQTNKSIFKESMPELERQLSQRYSVNSIGSHRQKNPTFLNSIL